ncbi:MAG: hypothetical protein HN368_14255 [Spirochaetales bacterium]|jgi:uroporphyrinogen decarboxylase|nr:hypothetical protein [Spirochaetales bacterium]
MDSRERVYLTLNHEVPDRVPVDFWASKGAWDSISRSSGMTPDDFQNARDIDFRYINGPVYTGRQLGDGFDIWGVRRTSAHVTTAFGAEEYSEVSESPLANKTTADEIIDYPGWPNPDDYDYSVIKKQAERVRDLGRIVVFMGDRLNRVAQLKPAMYLRGVERILLDLAILPEVAAAIFDQVSSFYKIYLTRILEAADGLIDIVLTGDDFGQQRGMMISPPMWNDFLAPGFAEYMDIIRGSGTKSMHHTCGDVRLITPRMCELGLDILQSMQPEAMSDAYDDLKETLGDRLSFHGGISIQQTIPQGSILEIEAEVQNRIAALGEGGGYILCTAHNIQADCSYQNITALLEAYTKYGGYPNL